MSTTMQRGHAGSPGAGSERGQVPDRGLFARLGRTVTAHPVRVALGLESHWAYLERKVSYASVAEWAEAKLDPGERTLFLGESRTAYWPGPTLASTVFEPNPLAGWLERSPDAASLAAQARRSEVSYVLVNQAEWKRIESSDGPHYQYAAGPGQARVLSEWMGRWLQLLVTRDGCTLYRLKRAA